jgi:hypothetical protein
MASNLGGHVLFIHGITRKAILIYGGAIYIATKLI